MLGREGRKGQGAGAARRTANEGTEKVSTGRDGWSRSAGLEKGTRLRDGVRSLSCPRDFSGYKTNLYMIHIERVGIKKERKRERRSTSSCMHLQWPSKLFVGG